MKSVKTELYQAAPEHNFEAFQHKYVPNAQQVAEREAVRKDGVEPARTEHGHLQTFVRQQLGQPDGRNEIATNKELRQCVLSMATSRPLCTSSLDSLMGGMRSQQIKS